MTPIPSSIPATTTLSGRTYEVGPAPPRDHADPAPGTAYPRFTLETPDGDRIAASGAVARLPSSGGDAFAAARSWLASLAASSRMEGGRVSDSLLAMVVFPFDTGRTTASEGDLHLAWIPKRVVRRDPSGRVRAIEWRADEETLPPGPADRAAWAGEGWTRDGWTRAVETALDRIRSGSVRKVVLARSRKVTGPAAYDPERIFRALGDSYPGCYRYRYESGDGSVFLGASPERLVALRSGRIEADAVAGTSAEEGRPLLADPKERLEHDIVVQEILSALGPVADRVGADAIPSVHRLRHVAHLRTRIRGDARPGAHVLDLVARIHPSPAVAGAPREGALELIRSLEPHARGWYAGPIGWTSAGGEGEFTLGLRAALLRGADAWLHAGAGIVPGSDPGREWDECESKMRAMEEALVV